MSKLNEIIQKQQYLNLPPGCIGSNNPIITCVPTKSGNYNISCTITDSVGTQVSVHGTLKVKPK